MIIGVTGKSGVGKSTYAKKLAENSGFYVIHVDEIAHEIIARDDIRSQLLAVFGDSAAKDGEIDKKYIGDLVFTNRHLYRKMRDLIWGEMKQKIDYIISTHENVVLDWIILPSTHYWDMCDNRILITADDEKRKLMVMRRDAISAEYLEKRDSASISYDGIKFDEIIENNYMEEHL